MSIELRSGTECNMALRETIRSEGWTGPEVKDLLTECAAMIPMASEDIQNEWGKTKRDSRKHQLAIIAKAPHYSALLFLPLPIAIKAAFATTIAALLGSKMADVYKCTRTAVTLRSMDKKLRGWALSILAHSNEANEDMEILAETFGITEREIHEFKNLSALHEAKMHQSGLENRESR